MNRFGFNAGHMDAFDVKWPGSPGSVPILLLPPRVRADLPLRVRMPAHIGS